MSLNPEFRRNLWLEWSLHRALLIGILIATLVFMVKLFVPSDVVAHLALVVFVIAALGWGSRRASDAVIDELREKTWDTQRMSALNPWAMTWGKLFGATVVPWYTGGICLFIYFVEREGLHVSERLHVAFACVAAAVILHALSLIAALASTRRNHAVRGLLHSWLSIFALVVASTVMSQYYGRANYVSWFGIEFARAQFLGASLGAFALWFVFGAYRQMCTELAVATKPWAWLGFIIFCSMYGAGHYSDSPWRDVQAVHRVIASGLAASLLGAYVCAFILFRDPLSLRRLSRYARARQWSRFFDELPVWVASFAAASLFALGSVLFEHNKPLPTGLLGVGGMVAPSLLLVCARDLAVLFFFTFGRDHQRVETSALIVIAAGFWLLPRALDLAGLAKLGWLLQPPIAGRPGFSAGVLFAQLLVIVVLCVRRYRRQIAPP